MQELSRPYEASWGVVLGVLGLPVESGWALVDAACIHSASAAETMHVLITEEAKLVGEHTLCQCGCGGVSTAYSNVHVCD